GFSGHSLLRLLLQPNHAVCRLAPLVSARRRGCRDTRFVDCCHLETPDGFSGRGCNLLCRFRRDLQYPHRDRHYFLPPPAQSPVAVVFPSRRLSYFLSARFGLVPAFLFTWLEKRRRAAAFALLAVAVAGLGIRTVARNRDWRDNASLYMFAADAVPNSAKMRAF